MTCIHIMVCACSLFSNNIYRENTDVFTDSHRIMMRIASECGGVIHIHCVPAFLFLSKMNTVSKYEWIFVLISEILPDSFFYFIFIFF